MAHERTQLVAGLDLGAFSDHSALVVDAATAVWHPVDLPPYHAGPPGWWGPPVRHAVRHVQRWGAGTAYSTVIADVRSLLRREEMAGSLLVVDATGCGAPVVDMLRQGGLAPVAVVITPGSSAHVEDGRVLVPKADLVTAAVLALEQQRLAVSRRLEGAETLLAELAAYSSRTTASGHVVYGNDPREARHDDLALALMLAVWAAETLFAEPEHLTAVYNAGAEAWARHQAWQAGGWQPRLGRDGLWQRLV